MAASIPFAVMNLSPKSVLGIGVDVDMGVGVRVGTGVCVGAGVCVGVGSGVYVGLTVARGLLQAIANANVATKTPKLFIVISP